MRATTGTAPDDREQWKSRRRIAVGRTASPNDARANSPHVLNGVRWSGAAGVFAALLLLIASPLYIMMGTPPPLSDASAYAEYLTRIGGLALATKIIDTVYVGGFIVFITGFRELVRSRGADCEWLATLAFAAGLVSSVIILVGDVLGAAAALDTYSTPDPVVIRALTEAALPAFGAIGLAMTVLFLVPASWGIITSRTLPTWTGRMGYAVAVVTLIAAGTIFGGNEFLNTTIWGGSASVGVYSYSTSIAGVAFVLWLLIVGLCMVRVPPREPAKPTE